MRKPVLFVGPTLSGLAPRSALTAGIEMRPPVKRGDVDDLCDQPGDPGDLILCDGSFGNVAAVSHAELCRALDSGWRVWGVSSLGAIRARELRDEGMRGSGYVYDLLCRSDDVTDDELCVLHFPEEPYFPVSEALVNVRYGLEQRGRSLGVTPVQEERIVRCLKDMWFGDRIESTIRRVMHTDGALAEHAIDELLQWIYNNRIKTIDLEDLLVRQRWIC